MKKMSSKQVITAAFLAAVVGLSSAPLGASALGDNSDRNNNSWNRDRDNNKNDDRDNNRRNDNKRGISEWQARRIAQNVFPHKHIVRVELRGNGNGREYQVRFADGSRVDVRVRDGRVTFVNNTRRGHLSLWR